MTTTPKEFTCLVHGVPTCEDCFRWGAKVNRELQDELKKAKIEALRYIDGWCMSHATGLKNASYLAALDDIRVHCAAAIERIEHGERMEATTPLCSPEEK